MVSLLNEDCLQIESSAERSPAQIVFSEALCELYWSKSQLMRTLLKLENEALNVQLQRIIHDYFEASRTKIYSIEHAFELLDESPEVRKCAITVKSCTNALAMLGHPDKTRGKDKLIRSCIAEFYAQEITSLGYLVKLALTMGRLDIAQIIGVMQRKTRAAFEFAFPMSSANTEVAA